MVYFASYLQGQTSGIYALICLWNFDPYHIDGVSPDPAIWYETHSNQTWEVKLTKGRTIRKPVKGGGLWCLKKLSYSTANKISQPTREEKKRNCHSSHLTKKNCHHTCEKEKKITAYMEKQLSQLLRKKIAHLLHKGRSPSWLLSILRKIKKKLHFARINMVPDFKNLNTVHSFILKTLNIKMIFFNFDHWFVLDMVK